MGANKGSSAKVRTARGSLLAIAIGIGAMALPSAANASLVYDSSQRITGTGFGNVPRLITLQEVGQGDNVESACVSVGSGGSFRSGAGSCISDSLVHQGNGITNTGGDEVNPMGDNQKYGIPTVEELGWENAGDIALVFNATEPSGNDVNIQDLTLKFYDGSNLVAAIDGSQQFDSTFAGNGVAGFTFVVDQAQQDYLNQAVFGQSGFEAFRIALESTISGATGGPESFFAAMAKGGTTPPPGTPVPAPGSLLLFGLGVLGVFFGRGLSRRKLGGSHNL